VDSTKIDARKDYTQDDKRISADDARADFVQGFSRLGWCIYFCFHIATGIFVDLWRVIMSLKGGSASKEGSQFMGRATFWALLVFAVLAIIQRCYLDTA
jgi:hypothetical protein